jgi:hypothetical protein
MPTDPLFLPATPSLSRLAMAYLLLSPFGFGKWFVRTPCAACNGEGRGFRNAAGEFHRTCKSVQEAEAYGYLWWACSECRGYGHVDTHAVPLHVPAGLAVARLRLAEVLRVSALTDVQRVYVNGELVDIHYTDRTGNVRHTAPIARVAVSVLETLEAPALALALRHLDPELHEAGGSDV